VHPTNIKAHRLTQLLKLPHPILRSCDSYRATNKVVVHLVNIFLGLVWAWRPNIVCVCALQRNVPEEHNISPHFTIYTKFYSMPNTKFAHNTYGSPVSFNFAYQPLVFFVELHCALPIKSALINNCYNIGVFL